MQAVIIDCFGVIIKQPFIATPLAQIINKPIENVHKLYKLYESGELSREQFWKQLCIEDFVSVEKKLLDYFELDPNLKDVIEKLKMDYKLGIISNSDSVTIRGLLRRFELEEFFETIVVSQEVKLAKPDPAIYRKALADLNINAEECIMVDDRIENLRTAHELGMKTVYRRAQPQNDAYKPDYAIDELPEILNILEDLS